MVITQKGRLKRKASGGRYHPTKGKKKCNMGRAFTETRIGKTKIKNIRTKGGGTKTKVYLTEFANVANPKTKKISKTKIKKVLECPANRNYARRNILVKGTIIDTEIGKAKITSRPGQDGTVNAVLI
ncbi:30S ribosomal protein S8e [Candidatus Woesearchaeota archaeon]|nr:MAG: 30S ribosomal protein S8e [Candidatus Woesearchaeota archaeon]